MSRHRHITIDRAFSYSRPTCNQDTAVSFCELSSQLYSTTESFDMQSKLLIAALSNRYADQRVDKSQASKNVVQAPCVFRCRYFGFTNECGFSATPALVTAAENSNYVLEHQTIFHFPSYVIHLTVNAQRSLYVPPV
jgi:hypothetical protein